MAKRMLIDALHAEETRVVILDDNQILDFDFISTAKKQLKGNIYLAKITRVEPSLQAAFVEYGGGKQGFLPFAEIHADYYQIPVSDRKRLMEEAAREETPEEIAEDNALEAARETDAFGDTALVEAPASEVPASPEAGEFPLFPAAPELPLASAETQEEAHPAYLTQGALDVSISEEVLAPDEPFTAAAPAEETSEPLSATLEAPAGDAAAEGPKEDGVETLPSEEEEYQGRPKRNLFFKRYKIQEVIRRGQIVLVQVIKEERGNKGASLTTYLSLAGRYCVLMPNSPKDGGVSRKIASVDDRKRLKAIYTELKLAAGMSVIIRTAGLDRTRAEIKRDYDYLVKLWNQIREDTLKSTAPALIYEESDIIKRAIRDQYSSDMDELVVEGDEAYHAAREFMKLLLPSHTPKIKHYKEGVPLFYAYNVEEQLLSMHDPVVKLRSGGYIVINPTEALISIDVNSGRSTGERNIEETAAKTNLEAAAEVARQLRLRDLAGLIVIDFIDMMESRNRRNVEKMLKDSLKADRAKIQLGRISPFGLLEMSRQRLRPSISETNMVQCPHCVGRGYVRSNESMSIQMIRALEKEASTGTWGALRLIAPQSVALHLLNHKREVLRALETRHGISVQVLIGPELTISEFNLEKMRRGQGEGRAENTNDREPRGDRQRPRRERGDRDRDRDRERARPPEQAAPAEAENDTPVTPESADDNQPGADRKRRRRRGGRGRNNRFRDDANAPQETGGEATDRQDAPPTQAEQGERAPREGREPRGGRRRWRDRDERTPRENAPAPEPQMELATAAPLPAFATVEPVYTPPPARPVPAPVAESTPRDPAAPVKKGWWKKMIELD